MRLVIALLPGLALLTAACDRQSAPAPQAKDKASAVSNAVTVPPANAISLAPATPAEVGEVDRRLAGAPFPASSFEGPDGPVTLAKFAGKPVLVNLWATWCVPCITEMPTLDSLAAREAGRVSVIALSQDTDRETMTSWWAKQSYTAIKPYLDAKGDFSFAYGGVSLPTTILYDAKGREVWRVAGATDWAGNEAKMMLAEAFEQ